MEKKEMEKGKDIDRLKNKRKKGKRK